MTEQIEPTHVMKFISKFGMGILIKGKKDSQVLKGQYLLLRNITAVTDTVLDKLPMYAANRINEYYTPRGRLGSIGRSAILFESELFDKKSVQGVAIMKSEVEWYKTFPETSKSDKMIKSIDESGLRDLKELTHNFGGKKRRRFS